MSGVSLCYSTVALKGTEFVLVVADSAEATKTLSFESRKLPKERDGHTQIMSHKIQTDLFQVQVWSKAENRALSAESGGQPKLGPGNPAVAFLEQSSPSEARLAQKFEPGGVEPLNPLRYSVELELASDCRVDVRLDGRVSEHFAGFARDSLEKEVAMVGLPQKWDTTIRTHCLSPPFFQHRNCMSKVMIVGRGEGHERGL